MPATLISPQPKSVYEFTGKNFAPKKALLELAKNKRIDNPSPLCESLLAKYKEYKNRDSSTWKEHLERGKMVANLTSGQLLLLRHAIDNRYMFVPRDGRFSDNKSVGGQYQFYRSKLDAEWLSSRPERDPICPSDDDQIEEFISAVKIVQDFYNTRFFTDEYELLEMDSLACFGTSVSRFRFDPDIEEIICELLPFPACRYDIRVRPEQSDYFIYESKCAKSVLSHLLDAEINGDDAEDSFGLQLMEQITTQGGGVSGQGKESNYGTSDTPRNEVTVTEMWLQPSAYCDIDLPASEMTQSGISLPKGRSLLKTFPVGMCVVGINGMKTIIAIYPENHKDHIVSGIYHLQSYSGLGKGVSDTVDVMKELNDIHSQLTAHVKAHSTPGWGYNKDMVSEDQARDIGKPKKNIPFDFSNAPDGVNSINQAIQAIVPTNPAQAAFEYKESLKQDLQMAFQVTNFSDGLPGVNNDTAYGVREGQSLAQTLLVPQHRQKAHTRKNQDKVIYNLFKRFVNKPMFFASKDLNGITAGQTFSGDKFKDVDIDFQIVSDSEIPRTPLTKANGMGQLLQSAGGLAGLLEAVQMNPEITSTVAMTFGADVPIPKRTEISRVCRKRIEQAKKLLQTELQLQGVMAQVTGQQPDNANLAAAIVSQLQPPISPKEPYFQQKVAWLAELLDNDEMQYAPNELRYVIEEMIDRHLQSATLGQAQVEQDQNMAMIMAQLPQLIGEQIMTQQNQALMEQQQQQQVAEQQQQAMAQNQQALAMEQAKANIAATQAKAGHDQAREASDDAHGKALQLKALDHLSSMEQAKAKPAAKAAKR